MKKTILKIAVKAAFLSVVLALTGCSGTGGQSSSFSGNNGGDDDSNSSSSSSVSGSDESIIESDVIPTSARQAAGEGKLGMYVKPYVPGDVLFDDGSATPITSEISLTEEQQNHAIAVIFFVGKGLNSANTESQDTRTLGVGLTHSNSKLKWADSSANGYKYLIETIKCSSKTSGGKYICTGDRNGSDNLDQMSKFLKKQQSGGVADDTANASLYPAFYWAKNYGTTYLGSTSYTDGWYLPTVAEMYAIYQCQDFIDLLAGKYEFSKFEKTSKDYWTSTQNDGKSNAPGMSFNSSNISRVNATKSTTYFVCAIREF